MCYPTCSGKTLWWPGKMLRYKQLVRRFSMSHTQTPVPSLATQTRDLPAGESYTRCRRVPLKGLARHDLSQEVDNLRNSVNSAMYRASADTGQEYILDNIQVVPPSRDSIMLLAVVTRTA